MAIIVHAAKCIGCGACVLMCPFEAITVSESFTAALAPEECTGCLECLGACSNDALEDR